MARIAICCAILLMFLPIVNVSPVSAYVDSDFTVTVVPIRHEFVIGGDSGDIYFIFNLSEALENENLQIIFAGITNPDKVNYVPTPSSDPLWTGQGWRILSIPITISLMPDHPTGDEHRLDFYFYLEYSDNGQLVLQSGPVSFYIVPVEVGSWNIASYTPDFTTMTDNENEILYMVIQNSSAYSRTFNIGISTLNHGFSVSPASDTVIVNPDSTYEWTSTLTCTGFGLSDNQFRAVSWKVTDVNTGISKFAGATVVTYVGLAPTPVTDISIEWFEDEMEIPFGSTDNAYLIIRNIGAVPLTLTIPRLELTFRAADPIWPYDIIDTGWVALGAGDNENVQVVFWARGDPEEMDDWARVVATIEDNFGNRREAILDLRAVVGTTSLSVIPEIISLQRGQTQNVVVRITNNENANRSYIITAEEEQTQGIYWARSNPSVENVALTPFTSRDVTIQITATAPRDGIWPYQYEVRCEQTDFVGRVQLSIEILTLPSGTYPQQFPSLLLMMVPLTGSIESAGYIMSVVVILIFIMIGLAMVGGMGGGNQLGTIIMTVFAITLVTVLGWFPSWIMGLTILILALGMARWMHEYY